MVRDVPQFWFISGMLATLALAGTATVGNRTAVAQTDTSCNAFQPGTPAPRGFGAAWNVLSDDQELLLATSCNTEGPVTYTVGNGSPNLYIYKTRYYWSPSQERWISTTLEGDQLVGNDWYVGQASVSGPSTPAVSPFYWVAYVCQWTGNQWKCGCRDTSCSTNHWQLQAWQQEETEPSKVTPCANPTTFSVNPSNIQTTIDDNAGKCLVLNMAPGQYPRFTLHYLTGATARCTAPAMVDGQPNLAGGCVSDPNNGFTVWDAAHDSAIILENMVFYRPDSLGKGNYGPRFWHAKEVRVANSAFVGPFRHSLSTKYQVGYIEIVDNYFDGCPEQCIEAGQSMNAGPCTDWTSDTMVVRNNAFNGPKRAITVRNMRNLYVHGNEFRNVSQGAIYYWPWTEQHNLCSGGGPESVHVPAPPPLRTEVMNNTFIGGGHLLVTGRGVIEDSLLLKGNSGAFTCEREQMDAAAVAAHDNEQTTAPPTLDPASDVSC